MGGVLTGKHLDIDANTVEGALSEAAFLTNLERNADVVLMASYAPLLARLDYAG